MLVDDPARASRFYESALGWNIESPSGMEEVHWLVTTGNEGEPGIDSALMARHFSQPFIKTVEVASLTDTLEKVKANGEALAHGPNEISGIGTHACCADTEGNMFGLPKPAPTAS